MWEFAKHDSLKILTAGKTLLVHLCTVVHISRVWHKIYLPCYLNQRIIIAFWCFLLNSNDGNSGDCVKLLFLLRWKIVRNLMYNKHLSATAAKIPLEQLRAKHKEKYKGDWLFLRRAPGKRFQGLCSRKAPFLKTEQAPRLLVHRRASCPSLFSFQQINNLRQLWIMAPSPVIIHVL